MKPRAKRPGRREREARNRHKRTIVSTLINTPNGPEWETVKLGHRKHARQLSWFLDMAVGDSRKHVKKDE